MRAEASEEERPWLTEVASLCAVSCGDRREYADVIDEGVALRCCGGSGGCSNGEAAREGFEGPAEAWYSGNEGVDALDMLAWPKGQLCATLERGLSVDN